VSRQSSDRIPEPSLVGHYAGFVTRAVAYALDVAISGVTFAVLASATSYLFSLVLSRDITVSDAPTLLGGAIYVLWLFLYFFASWSVAGKSPGMALLGLRIVRRDGNHLDRLHAFYRVIAFPLSFLILGIGFLGIIFAREHRALHDKIADTAVVYDWDARAARLRILAAGATARLTDAPATSE
jgi:uncharacterized RDD family membrane protein YckC